MAKKKSKQILRPWCWYCEREFEDEKVLMQHQKAKHFKCNMCPRRLNTAGGLAVHIQQVHKLEPENLPRIENALPGRDGYEVEIFGMEGIPAPDVADYKRRKEIELGLSAGSISQPQAKRPKTENRPMSEDELRAQLEAHKALMGAADAPNPSSSGHGASGAESSGAAVMYGAPPQAYGAGSPMGPTPPGMMPTGAPPFFPGMPPPGFPPGSSPPGAPGQMPFSPFPPGMMPPGPPPGNFGFSPPPGYPIPPPGMQLPPPGSSPNAFPLPPPPPGVRVGPSMPAPVPGQQPQQQQPQQQQPPFPGAPPFPPNGQAAPPFPPQNGQPQSGAAPPFPPNGQPPFPMNGQGAPPFPPQNGQFPPGFPPFPPGGGPPPFGYPPPNFSMPPNPNMPPNMQHQQQSQHQQQQQGMPPLMNTPPSMPGSTPMPPPISGGTPGQGGQGHGMQFTPPPGTPMPPTPQSGTFGGQGGQGGPYTSGGSGANGAGGAGVQGGQGAGGGQQQPPQLVLPNPALAQTNPEMKKKTELKYVDANFSPDEVRAIHPKYYFPKGQPYTPTATATGGGYVAAGTGEEPRGKKRARAEDFL